ncbi:hypothetical protein HQQ80_07000 [Microbacteriaceae bacterium VKM Ac-2855]|nr:hypothetical protein [Microbacteriaceae bacterium VKM Ac-2855]
MSDIEVVDAVIEMTAEEAKKATFRIGLLRDSITDAYDKFTVLVIEAYERRAWSALGFTSWDAYAAEHLAVKTSQADRLPIVAALTNAGMSTRGIAAVTKVSNKTIHQDQQVLPPGNSSPRINSADGKSRPRPAPKAPEPKREPNRRPITSTAHSAVVDLRNIANRFDRIIADDRLHRNREALGYLWAETVQHISILTEFLDAIRPEPDPTVDPDTGEVIEHGSPD